MTRDEIDTMWQQAMQMAVEDGEMYTRYRFAKLVAQKAFADGYEKGVAGFMQAVELEREACANICETLELPDWPDKVRQPLAQAIRARGQA